MGKLRSRAGRARVFHLQVAPFHRRIQAMSILSALLGDASSSDTEKIAKQIEAILAPGEVVESGYKLVRDLVVFTDRRIVFVDKQGITGKRTTWLSIPYSGIVRFAAETAGHFDLDSELLIWTKGDSQPVKIDFRGGGDILQAYRTLSGHIS